MSKPKKVFKKGSIRISIWANSRIVRGDFVKTYSATIDKVYKDGNEWKYTKSFSIDDLPQIASAVNEAYQDFSKRNERSIRKRKKGRPMNPMMTNFSGLAKQGKMFRLWPDA